MAQFDRFSFSNVSTTIDPIWDISLDLGPGLPALTNNGSNNSCSSISNVSTTIDPIWDISLDLGPGLPVLTNNGSIWLFFFQ